MGMAASLSHALIGLNSPLTVDFQVVSLNIPALNILAPTYVDISTSRSGNMELKGTLLGGCSLAGFQRQAYLWREGESCGEADTPGKVWSCSCWLCWMPPPRAGSQASTGFLDSCPSWPRTTLSLLSETPGPEEPLSVLSYPALSL